MVQHIQAGFQTVPQCLLITVNKAVSGALVSAQPQPPIIVLSQLFFFLSINVVYLSSPPARPSLCLQVSFSVINIISAVSCCRIFILLLAFSSAGFLWLRVDG